MLPLRPPNPLALAAAAVPLSGEAFSALIGAHAALRQEDEAAALAGEAVRKGVPLSAEAYLAALSSVRSPAGLREVVAAMQGALDTAWADGGDEVNVRWWTYTHRSPHLAVRYSCELYDILTRLREIMTTLGWHEADEARQNEFTMGAFHCTQVHMYPRTWARPTPWCSPRELQCS